ncbi:hypothetical protein ACJ41O_006141 [Fusarium nematophilum]
MITPVSLRRPLPRRAVIAAILTTCVLVLLAMTQADISDSFIPLDNPFFGGGNHDNGVKAPRTDDYRILSSRRNSMGLYNTINVKETGHKIMNPTLLELPNGSKHDFLVIARAFHVETVIKGKKYKLARQVATFADLRYNRFGPELKSGEWSKLLVKDFTGPEHHCKAQPKMDQYIGPEDMKLFWTRKGAPILIFTYQVDDENLCEGMFLIDARAAVPELVGALGRHARKMPPIQFQEPTPLRRTPPEGHESDGRYQREKNWAPTQSIFAEDEDELMFMVETGNLFKWAGLEKPLEEVTLGTDRESAVEAPYPPDLAEGDETWHSEEKTCMHDVMQTNRGVHQSTPMLSLTLCDRGECEPSEDNTVMISMVQQRHDRPAYPATWYDHRIAVYAAAPPFNLMGVSKKLSYHGEVHTAYTWTGSMVFLANQTGIPGNRSHGYLDDEIWLSFGIGDSAPGWLDIKASELVTDHYFCEGASEGYRKHIRQGS